MSHYRILVSVLLIAGLLSLSVHRVHAAENAALWKHKVKGDFATVLANIKSGLKSGQFVVTGEENLSKGLENNKKVFGEKKWNTIGFENVTALHFCSMVFNQEVFNIKLDWSILCPFKLVVYNMKKSPKEITIITVRPSYLLKNDKHKKARLIGKRMDKRIIDTIKAGLTP